MQVLKLNIQGNSDLASAVLGLLSQAKIPVRVTEVEFSPAGEKAHVVPVEREEEVRGLLLANEAMLLPLHFYAVKRPVTAESVAPSALRAFRDLIVSVETERLPAKKSRRIW